MGKLVTSNFSTHNAKQFVESISETANSIYYMTVGKHTAFSNDLSPPTSNNSNEAILIRFENDVVTILQRIRVFVAQILHDLDAPRSKRDGNSKKRVRHQNHAKLARKSSEKI